MTLASTPIVASTYWCASMAAENTANFGQKPSSGGMPARLNMNTASAAARPGLDRDNPLRLVAGLGNIYVCEALFRARIDPRRAAGKVSRKKLDALAEAIPAVLEEAIAAGGSTLRDFAAPDGELGYFSKTFDVYGREGEPCDCGGRVTRIVQGGRSTFFCPVCQR